MMKFSARSLASLPPTQRERAIRSLSPREIERLKYSWEFWARPEQIEPVGDWGVWLLLAGRGYGKTRVGAEWVLKRVRDGARRISLVGRTAADVRDTMVRGESG